MLGLQGVVVKSHGGADSYAFSRAINTAYFEVKNQKNGIVCELFLPDEVLRNYI